MNEYPFVFSGKSVLNIILVLRLLDIRTPFNIRSNELIDFTHTNINQCFVNTATFFLSHYDDVIMTMLASQITSLTVVYSIVYSGVNQRKHQSSASLAFVRAIHRGPVNFPHKWPVTRKMFPFDDVIMCIDFSNNNYSVIGSFYSPATKTVVFVPR